MAFIIGFLTFILVVVCLVLILLVLMQLPKKEAGAGLAFGGAATDALFGAGSGNFLTKATKYFATAFFVLCVLLAVLWNNYTGKNSSEFQRLLDQPAEQSAAPAAPSAPSAPTPVAVQGTNLLLTTPPVSAPSTNTPVER